MQIVHRAAELERVKLTRKARPFECPANNGDHNAFLSIWHGTQGETLAQLDFHVVQQGHRRW